MKPETVDLYFVDGLEVFTVPMESRGEWYHLPSGYTGKYTHSMVHYSHGNLTRAAALESAAFAALEEADSLERDAGIARRRAEKLSAMAEAADLE